MFMIFYTIFKLLILKYILAQSYVFDINLT